MFPTKFQQAGAVAAIAVLAFALFFNSGEPAPAALVSALPPISMSAQDILIASLSGLPAMRVAFSIAEVVKLTGLARATVYRRLNDGSLPSVWVGKRRLVTRAAIVALLHLDDDDSGSRRAA